MKKRPTAEQIIDGLKAGDRSVLSRAITLAESSLSSDRELVFSVLSSINSSGNDSIRIAISGPPGAGKSTLIEALGKSFTGNGQKVAVLSVDPSSPVSGGSILGDKTRMEQLSRDPLAFIRPSSTGNVLGGVASATGEAILLCEAAGYSVIFIETVGVGQSEVAAREVSDLFVLVLLPGAGDELQAMKKGIMEVPDIVLVNKSEGNNQHAAEKLVSEIKESFHYALKDTPVIPVSALKGTGLGQVKKWLEEEYLQNREIFEEKRKVQWASRWKKFLKEFIWNEFLDLKEVQSELQNIESKIQEGYLPDIESARKLLGLFKSK